MLLFFLLCGCEGAQSTLAPAGRGAEEIATLFYWMLGGAIIIWLVVVGLSIYALKLKPGEHDRRQTAIWIIGGGAIAPTLILTVLLIYGLGLLPGLLAKPPEAARRIEVVGYQWWWRVRYPEGDRPPVELANEIRLPVGEPVEFLLNSHDVIHSFWIPSLGGKMDMLPGRQTRLTLEPTKTGTFRGACAEYCGSAHALMSFSVVVMEPDEFESWLAAQRADAREPTTEATKAGRDLFFRNGCGACHAIRGTEADGSIGPDLTHVGSRRKLAADILDNDEAAFSRWIAHPDEIKPGVLMPDFDHLSEQDLRSLAQYLNSLE